MNIHDVVQGTPEWHAARASVDGTASEASAMMGVSKYQSRDDLIKLKATGIAPEISDHQQIIFNRGHGTEAQIRPHVESLVGQTLYPVTGSIEIDGLNLLASFDGLTMMDDIGFEHKLWNAELAACVKQTPSDLHMHYVWQMEQQLLVSGAEYILFVVSDGTPDKCVSMKYYPVAGRREQLIAGWKQFKIDVANYVHVEPTVKPIGQMIDSLPALFVDVAGSLTTTSNLAEFRNGAELIIAAIKTELVSDQDFADADTAIKWLDAAEKRIDSAIEAAMAKSGPLEEIVRTLKDVQQSLFRSTRLNLNKQVETQKTSLKTAAVMDAQTAWQKHVAECNANLGSVRLPAIAVDFAGAGKSKRTIDTFRSAINDELARAKTEANRLVNHIDVNLCKLREIASEHAFLFSIEDRQSLVLKDKEAVEAIARQKIAEYEATKKAEIEAEAQRIADEKIAAEAKRIADEKAAADAETQRLADERAAEDKRIADELESAKKPADPVATEQAETFARIVGGPRPEAPVDPIITASIEAEHVEEIEREIPVSVIGRGRPGDDHIINFLADQYQVDAKTVISWLKAMNLDAAEKRLAA